MEYLYFHDIFVLICIHYLPKSDNWHLTIVIQSSSEIGPQQCNNIKNNAWVTVNNNFGVTSEAIFQLFANEKHWQIACRVTPKSLFTVTNVLIYFLHAIWCPEHTIPLKQLSTADFAIVAKDNIFWLSIVTSSQLICDFTRILYTGIVTSYSSIVLARTNWRKCNLH